jgi:hypothetical protein
MDETPTTPSGQATWYMPGAGIDTNSLICNKRDYRCQATP